jgi:hypothetical protein
MSNGLAINSPDLVGYDTIEGKHSFVGLLFGITKRICFTALIEPTVNSMH